MFKAPVCRHGGGSGDGDGEKEGGGAGAPSRRSCQPFPDNRQRCDAVSSSNKTNLEKCGGAEGGTWRGRQNFWFKTRSGSRR